MLFAPQAGDPVRIVQASFGADNVLLDAHLENKSHNKIQVYRLGWVAVKKDDIRIGRGELVTVPEKSILLPISTFRQKPFLPGKTYPDIRQGWLCMLRNCNFRMAQNGKRIRRRSKKKPSNAQIARLVLPRLLTVPIQELAKRLAAMAVLAFLFQGSSANVLPRAGK